MIFFSNYKMVYCVNKPKLISTWLFLICVYKWSYKYVQIYMSHPVITLKIDMCKDDIET